MAIGMMGLRADGEISNSCMYTDGHGFAIVVICKLRILLSNFNARDFILRNFHSTIILGMLSTLRKA